jgi:RNA polymerase sigma factor (sigma-70 family)
MQPESDIDEATEVCRRVAELFRTQREPMTRLAYVLTRDPELSDEVVQDAFLRLHASWSRVDNPAGYLRTAVVNACHSHHRHLHVVRRTPIERVDHHEIALTDPSGDLNAALAALPFEQRAVLALRYFSDLHDDDIAAALGIRRATVRSRARRALDQLRKEITS